MYRFLSVERLLATSPRSYQKRNLCYATRQSGRWLLRWNPVLSPFSVRRFEFYVFQEIIVHKVILPARAVFGSVGTLLTMIRVCPIFHDEMCQTQL